MCPHYLTHVPGRLQFVDDRAGEILVGDRAAAGGIAHQGRERQTIPAGPLGRTR
jgi:hypothetical protein